MNDEEQIRVFMRTGLDEASTPSRTSKALSRVRRMVGQRDSIGFVLVRIWAALARILAALFAILGEKQARVEYLTAASQRRNSESDNQGEKHD